MFNERRIVLGRGVSEASDAYCVAEGPGGSGQGCRQTYWTWNCESVDYRPMTIARGRV